MCTLGQFWNVVCTFGGAGNLRLKAMNVMCFAADRTIIWWSRVAQLNTSSKRACPTSCSIDFLEYGYESRYV